MTDRDRIKAAHHEFLRAIAQHDIPARVVKEFLREAWGFGTVGATSERVMDAMQHVAQGGWVQPVGSDPRMPVRPSAGRMPSGEGK